MLSSCSVTTAGGVGIMRDATGQLQILVEMCSSDSVDVYVTQLEADEADSTDYGKWSLPEVDDSSSIELDPDFESGLSETADYRALATSKDSRSSITVFRASDVEALESGSVLAADWANHQLLSTFTQDEFRSMIREKACD